MVEGLSVVYSFLMAGNFTSVASPYKGKEKTCWMYKTCDKVASCLGGNSSTPSKDMALDPDFTLTESSVAREGRGGAVKI